MCIDKETGKTKLKFNEMISSGRTGTMSATGFMGIISGIISLIIVLALCTYYFIRPSEAADVLELMDRIIVIFSVSAGLLGVRKITGTIGNKSYSAGADVYQQQNTQQNTTYRTSSNTSASKKTSKGTVIYNKDNVLNE